MSTPQEKMLAFQSAQKIGKQYPGLLEALQEWATIGSLEQAADEARTRLEALRAEEQAAKTALEAQRAAAGAASQKHAADSERELANRRAVAAALVDKANLEARCILDTARAKAAELQHEAERQRSEHQAQLAAVQQELAGVSSRIESKAAELSSMTAAVEEMRAQHAHLTRLIGDLAAKL